MELKEKTKKDEQAMSLNQKGKMAIQMGGDIHYIDAPEVEQLVSGDEEFVQLSAEPKTNTIASVDSGYTFWDETEEQSA